MGRDGCLRCAEGKWTKAGYQENDCSACKADIQVYRWVYEKWKRDRSWGPALEASCLCDHLGTHIHYTTEFNCGGCTKIIKPMKQIKKI